MRRLGPIVLLSILLLIPPAAQALETAWQGGAESRARLLAAREPGQPERWILGIEIALAPGWKTYWRWPGEAGAPPRFDFSASENLQTGTLAWPLPVAFETFGARSLGYGDTVLFTLPAGPSRPDKPARVRLQLDYMVCETICIPERAGFDLPLAGAENPALATRLAAARAAAPGTSDHDIALEAAAVRGDSDRRILRITARAGTGFHSPRLIAVAGEIVLFAPPALRSFDDSHGLHLDIPLSDGIRPRAGSPLHLLLIDGERHVLRQVEWPQ